MKKNKIGAIMVIAGILVVTGLLFWAFVLCYQAGCWWVPVGAAVISVLIIGGLELSKK